MVTKTKTAKTKKRSVKKESKILKSAPKGQEFILCNGKSVKTIESLADELAKIKQTHYLEHVTKDNNDFANWIRHVFKEETLAKKIEKSKNISETRAEIYSKLLKECKKKR